MKGKPLHNIKKQSSKFRSGSTKSYAPSCEAGGHPDTRYVAGCDKGFLKHVVDISKQRTVVILFMFVLDCKELFVSIVDGIYIEVMFI